MGARGIERCYDHSLGVIVRIESRRILQASMRAAHKNALFQQGVELFNAQEFFKAHEAWEELWLHAPSEEKTFLQGIIQIAAALHHYSRGNLRGSRSLLSAGIAKLSGYPAMYWEVDVARLACDTQAWIDALGDETDTPRRWPQIRRAE